MGSAEGLLLERLQQLPCSRMPLQSCEELPRLLMYKGYPTMYLARRSAVISCFRSFSSSLLSHHGHLFLHGHLSHHGHLILTPFRAMAGDAVSP